jgi:RHS repeat-associated protein
VNIQWLVADHLGTPRMIANLSGDLAGPTGIKRHDYLPFGEELFAGTGGRTTGQGYSGDNVRQQFTGYERDDETGLDYAQARYFSSTQGRFTSPDPVAGSQINPQSLNRYAYVLNNPLRYTDPSGLTAQDGTLRDQGGRAWGTCGVSSNCLGELTSPITVTATYDFPIILEEITNQLSTAVSITPTIPLPSESFAGARLALDGIGMAPGFGEPFNIASGILGYLDGDYAGGTLSMMSAIPGLGNVTGVGAMGRAASQLDNVAGVADDAVGATRRAPNFIAPESGPAIIVPNGATGPIPAINGKGFRYTDGSGGHGLDLRTTDVRIMDPTSRYPNGYGSYSNSAGQTVNPYSGRTIAPSNPWWHIPRR